MGFSQLLVQLGFDSLDALLCHSTNEIASECANPYRNACEIPPQTPPFLETSANFSYVMILATVFLHLSIFHMLI